MWWCQPCGRVNESRFNVCPTCGRAKKGRRCIKCQQSVPKDAIACVRCGSDRLTVPGAGQRFPWRVRLGLSALLVLGVWMVVTALAPVVVAAATCLWRQLLRLLYLIVIFWLLTGLLPARTARWVRGTTWRIIRFAGRFIKNLLP